MEKLRIIIGGFIGVMPIGGVTWDYVQYPLGFSLLGHDVYYIEDTRLFPIYQNSENCWDDCTTCVEHLCAVMAQFGLKDRWAYRDEVSGKCFGMAEEKIKEVCRSADVFINLSCSTFLRDEYLQIPVKILIDSDPMFTQIQYLTQEMFTPGKPGLRQMIDAHNFHFTFGENIHAPDCRIPDCGLNWIPTRQPVCLDYWPCKKDEPVTAHFTTLMNWSAAKELHFQHESWGQKDVEFKKFYTLPQVVKSTRFSAVINKTGGTAQAFAKEQIEEAGWQVLDPSLSSADWKTYQQFIARSYAEFSVAKETYVKASTGWFSCRSACYLAAGKPVVTQDTAWSKYLPSGCGLFAFSTMQDAIEAIAKIKEEPQKHRRAARAIASDYFDSNKVLSSILLNVN